MRVDQGNPVSDRPGLIAEIERTGRVRILPVDRGRDHPEALRQSGSRDLNRRGATKRTADGAIELYHRDVG